MGNKQVEGVWGKSAEEKIWIKAGSRPKRMVEENLRFGAFTV